MRGGLRFTAGCGAALLCACAHLPAPVAHRALEPGTYEIAGIRTRLDDRLVDLSPEGTSVEGSDGTAHRYTARGALLLAADGTCRLLLDLRVDGGSPGHSERPCTWRSEADLIALVDPDGAATVYRVRREPPGALLEAVAELGPDGQSTGNPAGEQLLLQPLGSSPPLAQLPDGDGDEGGI